MKLFITGTGTNVGKTYISRLIVEALRREKQSVVALKPITCGGREDAQILLEAAQNPALDLDAVNPVALKSPAAPFAACLLEDRTVDFDALVAHCEKIAKLGDHVIVEGTGGWEVPISADLSMADLAAALGYPVVIVVDNKLGALNHTILTVRSIEAFDLPVAGVILNYVADERDAASISNRVVLEEFLGVTVLSELLHGDNALDITDLHSLTGDSA